MSAHRFFLTQPVGGASGDTVALPLSAADLHHGVAVLRIKPGEVIEAVEPGAGATWSVRVVSATSVGVEVELIAPLARVAHPRVTLVQGVAKGDKMDDIVRQAVELGAERIVPVLFDRSVVRLDSSKAAQRGERWRRIAVSAAKQAHRDSVPHVDDPMTLTAALPELCAHDVVIVLWEEAREQSLSTVLSALAPGSDPRVAVVIGPEGGLAAEEVATLERMGAHTVTLGPHVLRTETAALTAVALVTWGLGGLGGRGD